MPMRTTPTHRRTIPNNARPKNAKKVREQSPALSYDLERHLQAFACRNLMRRFRIRRPALRDRIPFQQDQQHGSGSSG
jgi:hypothetical protein